jgi:hypothetical protein
MWEFCGQCIILRSIKYPVPRIPELPDVKEMRAKIASKLCHLIFLAVTLTSHREYGIKSHIE